MAAITSIKDPLVNLNTNAHRQTHVDLQQPFEDIQNFTWLLQLLWSMSNIVTDKKWIMYNAIFHPCQHFTLPATKAQTNTSTKTDANINVVLCNDLQGAQRDIPVYEQQTMSHNGGEKKNSGFLTLLSSLPPGRCGHSSGAELRGSRWGPSLWTPRQSCWRPAHPESLAWMEQAPS